jgi:regulator of sigma E protease
MSDIFNFAKIGVVVVLLFGAAIFVHEFGHYWVALKRGLKVEEFAIGFGPIIRSWVRNGIKYSIRWIPAGGFVKLPQMITSSAIEGDSATETLPPVSPFSKILVAVAGPSMNVVFAFAIATVIYFVGLPVLVNPSIIGYVEAGSPEAKLGIQEGDKIVAVNGKSVRSWEDVYNTTVLALTNVIPVSIEHAGKTNLYSLKADVANGVDLKMLNLNPRDYLTINAVVAGSPAEKAQLQVGDQILEFAGVPITSFPEFTNLVQKYPGQTTEILVLRGTNRVPIKVTPAVNPASKVVQVGIQPGFGKNDYILEHPDPWSQISDVWEQLTGTLNALIHSHTSGVKASDLAGPVGIISVLAVKVNTDYRLALNFLVMLNINLAIINMLPMPVLDGGHIMMAILERIRRKPLDVRIVEYVTTVFAVLLICFMVYVTFFDFRRLPLIRALFNQQSQIEEPAKPASPPSPAPASPDQAPALDLSKPAPAHPSQ